MTSRKWRQLGHRVILRGEHVYLYRGPRRPVWVTAIAGGRWMHFDDLDAGPWVRLALPGVEGLPPFASIAAACYCDTVTACDFCTGVRAVPAELRVAGPLPRWGYAR